VRQGFASLRRPASSTSWETRIEQVIRDLEDLNGRTEKDFLTAGDMLIHFRTDMRRISSDMLALSELIHGLHGESATLALDRILELSSSLSTQVERSSHALAELRGHSGRLRLAFGGLRSTVAVFRTLCTLTRIETSRMGNTGSGFADLAAEARPLSESIQSCGESILESSNELDCRVLQVMQRANDLRDRQIKDLPVLMADVTSCLAAFTERRARARESSAQQAERSQALSESVNDMVGSVQFHDITRQQVEHVIEALRQLPPEPGATPISPESRAIIAMQSSQLASAAGQFAASVDRTHRDLGNISTRVADVAKVSRTLMGMSAEEQDGFFLDMETRFTAILKMLAVCAAEQVEMEQTVAQLDQTIVGMFGSVDAIRGIEIRIQRIALNAVIRAVHLGRAGDGLHVIAEIMCRLALDSNRSTEDAGSALQAIRDASRNVRAPSDSTPAQQVIDNMRREILDLHTSGESSYSRVTAISLLSEQLVREIGALRDGFSAGGLFAEVSAKARAELDRIAGQAIPASAEALELLSHRYTMQTERDVHLAVSSGAAVETAGDLGGNVELF
jgi:methyl-accepting chemotaxis protein